MPAEISQDQFRTIAINLLQFHPVEENDSWWGKGFTEWANENWTRAWDSRDHSVLLAQDYSPEVDRAHNRSLIPIFSDPRYLRVDGKIAFLIYRLSELPDPAATLAIWREEVRGAGLGELFVGAFGTSDVDLDSTGFDAVVEFAPSAYKAPRKRGVRRFFSKAFGRLFARLRGTREASIHLYGDMADALTARPVPDRVSEDRWLRCVTPGWDNSPRRKKRPLIFLGLTPERYERWLRDMITWSRKKLPASRRIVFINAWNEWAEGNHLEPDMKNGRAYLEATSRALAGDES